MCPNMQRLKGRPPFDSTKLVRLKTGLMQNLLADKVGEPLLETQMKVWHEKD